ncbi:uncharacterized protein AMSG_12350 [Thecamonas trahens ATCC 50062]|uniref:Small ribosomal subunit protein mS41 SAM domain-containing protein n=1 Tax=Thecamonas trahens ATCC 50062 TaxID=461836 RepID=A0A0L0DQF9_THETB|nr:hypothetical protein AMSG_12350 [Thecamonas trahens ATCC 50062]KNC54544.1 hypothetical protein AMSG_12350 [Thecamonas trahens ATCC 50062]|eukprot:XP_013753593.1 hypothetical protein AMSG_12350 [Thecamonas trahens ATCC 50062]
MQRQTATYLVLVVLAVYLLWPSAPPSPLRPSLVPAASPAALRRSLSAARVIEMATQSPLYNVRVPDTPGHAAAKAWLMAQLRQIDGFELTVHEFVDDTPLGRKAFANLIASSAPDAPRRIVLGAHYDSKLFDGFEFRGAIDSAVPCAMLLELAAGLSPLLPSAPPDLGFDIVLFDGEEAFVDWTATDSIYGARALAAKWAAEDRLARIELFTLIDLIGTGRHVFHDAHPASSGVFNRLADIEAAGRAAGWISDYQTPSYFRRGPSRMTVEDDHIPFLRRNVPVLHLIPVPFPSSWHTHADSASALEPKPIADILGILAEWLHSLVRPAARRNLRPRRPAHGMTKDEFLARIGRECDQYADAFESWDELFSLRGLDMKKRNIPVRQRRWILRKTEMYRQQHEPSDD